MHQELPKIPQDVEEFIDGSQHGVIFFALGIRLDDARKSFVLEILSQGYILKSRR